jgi:oligosaccharide repeat unit polymerase
MTPLLLIILCATVFSASYYNKDVFSPVRIYICTYSLLLAINFLNLSGLQTPWSVTTNLLFWGGSFFFIAGCCLMLLVNRIVNPDGAIDFRRIRDGIQADADVADWKWFCGVWLFCTMVFLASYITSAVVSGGIPLFSPDGDKFRVKFFGATGPSNYGLFFGPLSLILVTELLFFGSFRGKRRIAILIAAVATLLLYVTILTRLDLFRFSLFAIILYHYGKKKLGTVQILGVLGFSILFFFAFFLIRVKYNSISMLLEMQKLRMHRDFIWCASIYAYVVNNFWNMDFAFRKFVDGTASVPQGWGFDLSRAFLGLAHVERALEESFRFDTIMNESVARVKGLNTIVYTWHFFKDFGAFGAYFLPLVFGMITTSFYVNSINTPTLFRFSMWALIAPIIILSYSVPLWEFWFIYLNIVVVLIAHRRVKIAT